MNRAELVNRLRTAGRDPAGLLVTGSDPSAAGEGAFLLDQQDDRWVVATVDRGERFPHRTFDTESEACDHLFQVLTARRPRAPITAAERDEAVRVARLVVEHLRSRLLRTSGPMFRMLVPGEVVDRTGGDGGHYFFPVGTPWNERGLAIDEDDVDLRMFRVCDPFSVLVSLVTPAHGGQGGAVMYRTSHLADDIATLFEGEFLTELDPT